MKAIRALMLKQFLEIKSSFQLRALTLIAPLTQFIVFGFAFNFDVENITLSVLDFDQSTESRALISRFNASGYFKLVSFLTKDNEVEKVLLDGTASVVIIIPPDFAKRLTQNNAPTLQCAFDASSGNTAQIASNYVSAIIGAYGQSIQVSMQERSGAVGVPTAGNATLEPRVWYNPDLKSRNFFVPSILALILLLTTVIAASSSIVKERETGTLEGLIVSPITPLQLIIGKLAPFMVTASITMINLLILSAVVFEVKMRGNELLFAVLSLVFISMILGIGLFVSTISRTQQQAAFTTAFFILPPMLFLSGYAFPISSMPEWVQPITYFIPLRYFIVIVRGIFLKGNGLVELWDSILAMLICTVVIFAASFMRFRKSLE
ncbi:MAG: ABC transporter permease [Chloroherpetonaceae bacterium]|nr:ABC transporter permease [Chloroherpetonaceae bacterium]